MRLAEIQIYSAYGNYHQRTIENVDPFSISIGFRRTWNDKREMYVSYDWYLEGHVSNGTRFHSYANLPEGYQFSVFRGNESN